MPLNGAAPTTGKLAIALVCATWFLCASGVADAEGGVASPDADARPAETWRYTSRLRGDWYDAEAVALVDDPRIVIIADRLGKITLWDTEAGVPQFSAPPQRGFRPTVVADAAGTRIALGAGGRVTVWDPSTGARLHEARGSVPDMSSDGGVLAAVTARDTVTLWDVASGDVIRVISSGKRLARAVSLDATGARVAIGWANRRAEVWDVDSGARLMEAARHAGVVGSVDLTPDGSRLATSAHDHRARVWDVATGALVGTYGSTYKAPVTSVHLNDSGTRVVTAAANGAVDLWNVVTGKRVRRYARKDDPIARVALSPDGRRLAGVTHWRDQGRDRLLGYAVWRTGTGERLPAAESPSRFRTQGVQLSADGSRALAFATYRYASLHDVATGAEIRSFGNPPHEIPGTVTSQIHLLAVRLIGDGRQYLDAYSGLPVTVRDVETSAAITTFDAEPRMYYPFILSPDHSLLLTGGDGKHAHLWDVATGAHLRELAVDGDRVQSAAFDAANSIVATNGQSGPVRVWDVKTGEILGVVPNTGDTGDRRSSVSVSPDGRRLLLLSGSASARREGPPQPTAYLWDIRTSSQVATSPGWILGAAWAADSSRFYTASMDLDPDWRVQYPGWVVKAWTARNFDELPNVLEKGTWLHPVGSRASGPFSPIGADRGNVARVSTGVQGTVPRAHMQGITHIAISADGRTLAHAASDGSIDVWRRELGQPDAPE